MNTWKTVPTEQQLKKTINALKINGFNPELVTTKEEAKQRLLAMIPRGAEVMDMTSISLAELGIPSAIHAQGVGKVVKKSLSLLQGKENAKERRRLGAAPDYAIGSVHAVTEDGQVVVVSNTGSQLPAYVYGAEQVIWVVGAQKVVKNLDDAMKRIYDYVLPLEADRAKKAYGATGSNVSKVLILNKEIKPDRIHLLLVNEPLGF